MQQMPCSTTAGHSHMQQALDAIEGEPCTSKLMWHEGWC
jgi:hypothetical protein